MIDPYTATVLLITEIVKSWNTESQATRDAQGAAWQANLDEIVSASNTALKFLNIPLVLPKIIVYVTPAPKAP